ncbi:MAG: glycerophosphodiester phosphodiesterase [Halioglobus sp.]
MARSKPIVIAHRGASGYLPEHTLAAKALAHGMGADFLEQDVVLTKDKVPIVLHDFYLEGTTNVAQIFAGRQREDGHFYAMDFTLDEIRTLAVHERRVKSGGSEFQPAYPDRFPVDIALFRIPTLAEEIELIEGLNKSRGREAGFYIEFKSVYRHRAQGLDLVDAVMDVLDRFGLADKPERVFLQCFDDATLKRLKHERDCQLPLVQLIGDNAWGEDSEVDYSFLRSEEGLDYIASYANGIGPWLSHIYLGTDSEGNPVLDDLVIGAQRRGLLVHPYTFRRDALPPAMDSFEQLLALFFDTLSVDGLFTDFPDLAVEYLQSRSTGE